MSINVVNPVYMDAVEWTSAMTPALERFGNLARIDREDDWRHWGLVLLNNAGTSGNIVPNPYLFDDWRTWAQRLCANLSEMP